MYKVTIVESVGEICKEIIIETEDVELVREIIRGESSLDKVESDTPNLMIDEDYAELRRIWEEAEKKRNSYNGVYTQPYDPRYPWRIGNNTFEITC